MQLFDTHCHIQGEIFKGDPVVALQEAADDGVTSVLCVGTDLGESERAIAFAADRPNCWASIGLHPHEGSVYASDAVVLERFAQLATAPKVVAVGECGLDFYYNHSPAADQEAILRFQLELAIKHDLALVFHVRDAFEQFFEIYDEYVRGGAQLRGIIHSFTATTRELNWALERGLYIGLNGIMTFTKNSEQLEAAKEVPLEKLVLETDAPFLTPVPKRGTMNEPKNILLIAEFLSDLRKQSLEEIAAQTTANAHQLLRI